MNVHFFSKLLKFKLVFIHRDLSFRIRFWAIFRLVYILASLKCGNFLLMLCENCSKSIGPGLVTLCME